MICSAAPPHTLAAPDLKPQKKELIKEVPPPKWARSALRKRSHHPSQHAASPARATSCKKTHKLNDVYLDLKRLLSSHRTLWNRLPSKHTRLNDAFLICLS